MDFLSMTIELPIWFPVAAVLAGGLVSVISLSLSLLILNRRERPAREKVAKHQTTVASVPVVVSEVTIEPVKVVAIASSSSPAPAKRYKPVPPVRQQYWYYVSGVKGRFATLREALIASGVKVTAETSPDWKKLPSGTRDRITRYRLEDEQPVPEAQLEKQSAPALEPVVAHKTVARVASEPDSELVVRKSIGNGAFVTIKKKS